MACTARNCIWWDRDFDNAGRAIRNDVRIAACEVWQSACRQTIRAIGEYGPAPELMENVVAQVSRYLDRIGAPLASRKHGLVTLAFSRALRRYSVRLSRLELVGDSQGLASMASTDRWVAWSNARLDLEKMIHRLSNRNAEVLMLRAAGYEWKEIATLLGGTVSHLRNSFWREIDQIRWCRNVCVEDSVHFTSTCLQ